MIKLFAFYAIKLFFFIYKYIYIFSVIDIMYKLMMLFYFDARCKMIGFLTESKALEILFADSQPVQTSPLANSK